MKCIRCLRPIKSAPVHRLGPECARIILRQLTAPKQEPAPEVDRRQMGWVGQAEQQQEATA